MRYHRLLVGLCAAAFLYLAQNEVYSQDKEEAVHQHEAERPAEDGHGANEHHDHGDGHQEVDASVDLNDAELSAFGIRVVKASGGVLERHISAPGEIGPNQDALSHISPRFPGIAKRVLKNIGDTVKSGDVMAIIESSESLAPYEMTSLISGTVISKHITRGELLSEEDVAYTVADLSTVWVNLKIYQADLGLVVVGQEAEISQGHGQATSRGTISYVSPVVEEETRTALARAVIPNDDGIWRPGLFVTADILVERKPVEVLVPKTAIERVGGQPVVFIKTKEGFQPRPVQLGAQGRAQVEVLSGLTPEQEYVAEKGFTLKAEMEKGAFAAHGHSH